MPKMPPQHDECWICGKELKRNDFVVRVQLLRMTSNVDMKEFDNNVYDQCCLNCAAKLKIPGINFGNMSGCLPKYWHKQVTDRMLEFLYWDEYHEIKSAAELRRLIEKEYYR